MRDQWKSHAVSAPQREQIETLRKAYRAVCKIVDETVGGVYACRAEELLEASFLLAERGIVLHEPGDDKD